MPSAQLYPSEGPVLAPPSSTPSRVLQNVGRGLMVGLACLSAVLIPATVRLRWALADREIVGAVQRASLERLADSALYLSLGSLIALAAIVVVVVQPSRRPRWATAGGGDGDEPFPPPPPPPGDPDGGGGGGGGGIPWILALAAAAVTLAAVGAAVFFQADIATLRHIRRPARQALLLVTGVWSAWVILTRRSRFKDSMDLVLFLGSSMGMPQLLVGLFWSDGE